MVSVTKVFGVDYNFCDFHDDVGDINEDCGLVLDVSYVTSIQMSLESDLKNNEGVILSRVHPSGWTISGKICADYYIWVSEFTATHPFFGTVSGDFQEKVEATSNDAFDHFCTNHPPTSFDYGDI